MGRKSTPFRPNLPFPRREPSPQGLRADKQGRGGRRHNANAVAAQAALDGGTGLWQRAGMNGFESGWFVWGVLPLLIFLARIVDVALGTMRIIFVMRGLKTLVALLGFLEVFLWIVVISQIMRHGNSLWHYAAYAAGFATGNMVGMMIEERLAFGMQTVRIITAQPVAPLMARLREHGFGATLIPASGSKEERVTILFSTVRREHTPDLVRMIQETHPRAFVSVEDVRSVQAGVFPLRRASRSLLRVFPFGRKGK